MLSTFLAKVGKSELQGSSMQHCVDFEQSDKVLLGLSCWQSPIFGCSQMLVIREATWVWLIGCQEGKFGGEGSWKWEKEKGNGKWWWERSGDEQRWQKGWKGGEGSN